jgi:fatty-acyl-CoA synthase
MPVRLTTLQPAPNASVRWILGDTTLPGHVKPDHAAVKWINGTLTYRQLRDRALAMARAMKERGAKPGDRVAVHLFNRGEIFELYFACAYAGLTMVPINFRLSPREIGFIIEDCQPAVIFTETELAATMQAGVTASGVENPGSVAILGANEGGESYEEMAALPPEEQFGDAEAQLLLYTSGTTGRPKGVVMKHDNIMALAFQQSTFYEGMNSDAVLMVTGPMYNTAAINEQSIPTFLVGGTVVIMPSRGWRAERMAELMDQWSVSHALIYPSMIEPLLKADENERITLPTLRFALTGGENCPPAAMRKFMDKWPHITLMIAYGSTETGCVTLIKNEEILRHPSSVGRSIGGQTFTVVNGEGVPLEANEIGEIWTAGPATAAGYWRAPELDADVFVEGWVNTGDLGRVDKEGYLYIEGRSKDMIISKGQNIYPSEIENVLREHPAVSDVAVIGLPDEESTEIVCAVIVPRIDYAPTLTDITEFTVERLASFKKPRRVVLYDELPRNASAKVLKSQLTEEIIKGEVPSNG